MFEISGQEYLETHDDDAVMNDLEKYLDIAFDPDPNPVQSPLRSIKMCEHGSSDLTQRFTSLLESVHYFKQAGRLLNYQDIEVCRMRFIAGATMDQIGEHFKRSRKTARRYLDEALQKMVDKLREDAKKEAESAAN